VQRGISKLIGDSTKELSGAQKEFIDSELNADFLIDKEELEEYGQEIYNEFFEKTNAQLLSEYLASDRVKQLEDKTDQRAVVAII